MTTIILGLITGTLIGLVGVGGILLVPLLVYFLDMDLHTAMATCSFSFLFTGIAGSYSYIKQKSVYWPMVGWLTFGIIPGAVLGAKLNGYLPETILVVVLAILIGFSGINSFFKNKESKTPRDKINLVWLIVIGMALGFGSALTGTGGPVLLIPIFMMMQVPLIKAIGVSQVIQLPIAIFATLGFYLDQQVNIDFNLGFQLGIVQAIAVMGGAYIAHNISTLKLQKTVSVTLLGVACFLIFDNLF
ncbi:MAG: hypothetical protein COA86_17270 [Kangiella sp.]|nr:MAG: hypothetical protein COA86_17270 [Kangiella sp.]